MVNNVRNPNQNSTADLLDIAKRQAALAINCTKVGIIRAFNPATQRADVEIAYKQVKDVMEDGTKVYQDYPIIRELPVIVLFGGIDVLTMPITVGDNCLVFFNDSDIDQWAVNGNGKVPTTSRMHDISDGFALVGVRPLSNAINNYLANGIRLSHGGGNAQIDLTENLIESIATLFLHNGNMEVTGNHLVRGNFTVEGTTFGNAGTWTIDADINQVTGRTLKAGNGATGTFDTVTVVDGIVVSGS